MKKVKKEEKTEEGTRYKKLIEEYKKVLEQNPDDQKTRNLLAFAYLNDGDIDNARKELVYLIEKNKSFTAYRQIIHLEKLYGDIEDAELYALEAVDMFPNDAKIKKQLEDIYKIKEKNNSKQERE